MEFFILLCILHVLYLSFLIWKLFDQRRDRECYILDYECYKPSDDRMLDTQFCGDIIKRNKNLGLNEYKFLLKAIVSSGIGEQTYAPRNVFSGREATPTLKDGLSEMDEFFQDCIPQLLDRSGISPKEIDVLVVNVSMLATLPSLAARIINFYKLREDIKVFNLTGMGCSASLISMDLIRNIFKTHKNKYALLVTSESLSPNWYSGNDRSMILANCLFRSGGCAILLTNNRSLKQKAMFKLKCLVRIHHGGKDEAYNCCTQKEDGQGRIGFHLGKTLPKAATRAFVDNLREISPKILPVRELLRFAIVTLIKKLKKSSSGSSSKSVGGVGVGGGGRGTKSVSWYVLAYMEAKKRLKKGDRVLMISFGAGFKCNSCLWEVVKDLEGSKNVWGDCIDDYPPESLANPFMEKYGWINNEDESTFKIPE
ncbi:3-ketoacyl-CoA synthase 3 [Quillaja saponaria]|uniref:3-ketoacyl-CoA synthase n=1 Tax=Quillaja saponaria TaxID=32244 RepID=A0AAD7KXD2_QUISA|nr:3-ketoacyl-CoA synthase 3 [Quillaja saponaria]